MTEGMGRFTRLHHFGRCRCGGARVWSRKLDMVKNIPKLSASGLAASAAEGKCVLQHDYRHARLGQGRLCTGTTWSRPSIVPPPQIATVDRIDAPRADLGHDHAGVNVVGMAR